MGIAISKKEKNAHYLLENYVQKALSRVEGVARVQMIGSREKYIHIDLVAFESKYLEIILSFIHLFVRFNICNLSDI